MTKRVKQLIAEASGLSDGTERVAILDEAVREADAANDLRGGYWARMQLVDAAAHGGYHEKALVAFSWCLARFDADPQKFDEFNLLWKYKWILDFLPAFPQVSRDKIIGMQDDMEKRYTERGHSLRPVHYMRLSNFMRMGDMQEALAHHKLFKKTARDWMADCPACERDKEVELMARLGNDSKSLSQAQPILQGKLSCAEIPELTYGHIMRPLLRLGLVDEAAQHHTKGYRKIAKNPEFLRCVAEHLLYLACASNFAKGLRVFEKHLPWASRTAELDARFRFYVSAAALFEALARRSGRPRKLKLPQEHPCHREGGKYDVAELAKWFAGESQALAAQFNERNGNEYYWEQLAESRDLTAAAS